MSKLSDLAVASEVADADLVYVAQGGVSKQATRSLVRSIYAIAKAADESVTNSDVLQDDNHLVLTLPVGSYLLEGAFFLTTASGFANKFKCAFDGGTVVASFFVADLEWAEGGTDGSGGAAAALADLLNTNFGADTTTIAKVSGYITVSTAGTLKLRWAQQTANVTATTMKRGSWLRAIGV